ncbi:uncharacterized protein TNCV_4433321 [Trichonephila clavipes]|nr:uncharacterized protein TNCV_4433321 [Trichonephila clavipes]
MSLETSLFARFSVVMLPAATRSVCVFVCVVSSIIASCMCNAVPTGSLCVSGYKAERGSTIHDESTNTYIMSGEKNSTGESSTSLANRTIHSGIFQVANEEDFLNHSSLADIRKGGDTEDSKADDHLKELRPRNILCLPHSQSSYPLEMQNMTPSKGKYYEPSRELGSSTYVTDKIEFSRPPQKETDNNNFSERFILNKRKILEGDNFTNASKKIFHPSSVSNQNNVSSKPSTSVKRGTSLLIKSADRTQSRIQHLIGMHPKNVCFDTPTELFQNSCEEFRNCRNRKTRSNPDGHGYELVSSVRALVPQKFSVEEELMHIKHIEVKSPHVGVMWKFGRGVISSGIVLVT